MDCAEAIARLWEYLDGELPPTDHEALRAHLGTCRSSCPALHDFDRAFLFRVTRAGSAAPAASLILLQRVQTSIARPPIERPAERPAAERPAERPAAPS